MARELGAHLTVEAEKEDAFQVVRHATKGRMARLVMDVSGSEAGARMALELAGKRAR